MGGCWMQVRCCWVRMLLLLHLLGGLLPMLQLLPLHLLGAWLRMAGCWMLSHCCWGRVLRMLHLLWHLLLLTLLLFASYSCFHHLAGHPPFLTRFTWDQGPRIVSHGLFEGQFFCFLGFAGGSGGFLVLGLLKFLRCLLFSCSPSSPTPPAIAFLP
jgi:hypothetical protein